MSAPTGTITAPGPRALLGYGALDLRRQLRDRAGMFFIVALPAFMYLVFGSINEGSAGSGNVAMYVMASMAAYGAVTATTSVSGAATAEQTTGWGRQLALTPMRPLAFVAVKTGVALMVAAVTIAVIYALGAATGARGDASDWVTSAAIAWAGSAPFAIYGLAVCLFFRGANGPSIAGGFIVVLAFLGNVFTPLDGFMLDLGRLTPLYGYAGLVRYPMTDGHLPTGGQDSLAMLGANVLAWTVLFTLIAIWGLRRGRERV